MVGELTRKVGGLLEARLEGFAFRKTTRSLFKKTKGGYHAIFLAVLRSGFPGQVKLAAHAHLRVDVVADMYTRYHPLLSEREARRDPTLVANCDALLSDMNLAHEFYPEPEVLSEFIPRYANELRENVVPWLERYSDLEHLYDGLASDDPMEWVTSDRMVRYPVLLALLALRRDSSEFERVANEFREYCEKPHARVHRYHANAIIDGLVSSLSASPRPCRPDG